MPGSPLVAGVAPSGGTEQPNPVLIPEVIHVCYYCCINHVVEEVRNDHIIIIMIV